ncbi:hypothetical protein PybrP1_008279, partial [[Pythium] brassicae (nom. inval.)]
MRAAPPLPLPPLVSVAAVFRERADALSHAVDTISSFLDESPRWSIARAARSGYLRLLERLASRDGDAAFSNRQMQFEKAMNKAVRTGFVSIIAWLRRVCLPGGNVRGAMSEAPSALECAAGSGHVPVLEWFSQHRHREWGAVIVFLNPLGAAAAGGSLDALMWLHAAARRRRMCCGGADSDSPAAAMDSAARNGNVEVLQSLHKRYPRASCTTRTMDLAAVNGHLTVVEWLHAHRREGCTTSAMDLAAANGHAEVVQWRHDLRSEGCTVDAMGAAAREGRLEVVQWLHQHRPEGCTTDAMDASAAHGYLRVFQFLRAHRREACTVDAATQAAMRGHLDVLAFIFHHRRDAIDLVE